ncbi:MAG: glycerol-3-phosphate 1-O-acyltransferase PlsY [bacterium]
MRPAAVIIIAYLLGSIPFGYLIVRATQGADIRETGSGGTGATNVSRRAGKAAGVVTLLLDALKGAASVVIAKLVLVQPVESPSWGVAAAAIAVILGHIFPVWLRFRGGKGVATGVGVFLVLAPIPVAFAAVVFVLIVWRTRYVSLGSILAATMIPAVTLIQNRLRPTVEFAPLFIAEMAAAALIIFAHRANLGRLIDGTESEFR